jgi:hypothetical protein
MVSRDEAVAIALKLAAVNPPAGDRKIERVGDVYSMDGGLTWTVHLAPEPLDPGDGAIATDTPGVWVVVVCGRTSRRT